MREEFVAVLNLETGESVQTVKELKEQIKVLKGTLNETTIGSEAYQDTLKTLTVYQNALKDAMHGSTATMDDLVAGANGATESYNSLVHQMAEYKEELRNIDTATAEGKKQFQEVAGKINGINDKLKNLDAMQGNYQRNVGNYANSFAKALKGMGGATSALIGPMTSVNGQMLAMSANPIGAVIAALALVVSQLVKAFKSDEDAMNSLAPVMAIVSAAGDAMKVVFQKVAEIIGKGAEAIVNFARKIGLLTKSQEEHITIAQQEIELGKRQREILVENAKLDERISDLRFKTTEKEKYSAKERAKFLEEAIALERKKSANAVELAERELEIARKNAAQAKNSKEENDALAQAEAKVIEARTQATETTRRLNKELETLNAGLRKVKATKDEIYTPVEDDVFEELTDDFDYDAFTADIHKKRDEEAKARQDAAKAEADYIDGIYRDTNAAVEQTSEVKEKAFKEEMAQQEQRKAMMAATLAATSSFLGSLADIYESDTKATEKQLKSAKAMRVAGATIDMLSGVVAAVSQAMQLGPIAGPIMGAINSAAVIAAGTANIMKIKRQSTSPNASGTQSATAMAAVSAPTVNTSVRTVRNLTSASEEDRLNRAAAPQRVYILDSDLQAADDSRRVRVAEASW